MTLLIERLIGHFDDCPQPIGEKSETRALLLEAAEAIRAMQAALITARNYMTDFEGLPETDADNPLKQIDAAIAKANQTEPRPTPAPMSDYGANDMGYAQPIDDATYEPADGGPA